MRQHDVQQGGHFGGVHGVVLTGTPIRRLARTWERLCEANPGVAGALCHGLEQVGVLMARVDMPNSPADHQLRRMAEIGGVARIAREANPGAEVKTPGELIGLGEQGICRQVAEDTEEPGG